jgi:hypothetical protein
MENETPNARALMQAILVLQSVAFVAVYSENIKLFKDFLAVVNSKAELAHAFTEFGGIMLSSEAFAIYELNAAVKFSPSSAVRALPQILRLIRWFIRNQGQTIDGQLEPLFRQYMTSISDNFEDPEIRQIVPWVALEVLTLESCPRIANSIVQIALPLLQAFSRDSASYYDKLCCYAIGRLLGVAMKSTPLSEHEKDCRFVLESDLLFGVPPLELAHEKMAARNLARTLSPGLSRGISYDSEHIDGSIPEAHKKKFLDDMISPNIKDGDPADVFLKTMYAAVRHRLRFRLAPQFLLVERVVVAAFLKQLGLVNSAVRFARNVMMDEKKTEHIEVGGHFRSIWEALYALRSVGSLLYQHLQSQDLAQEVIYAELASFLGAVREKAIFLLRSVPLLRRRAVAQFSLDDAQVRDALTRMRQFLASSSGLSDFAELIQVRRVTNELRATTLTNLLSILQENVLPIELVRFLVYPLTPAFSSVSDIADIRSIESNLIGELGARFSAVF